MILLVGLAAGILTVPLAGGRLTRLDLRFHHSWLLVVALGTQVVITTGIGEGINPDLAEGLHLATYGIAGIWVMANFRIPGLLLSASGAGLNLIAIVANGGTMPASEWALRTAGIPVHAEGFVNSGVVDQAAVPWLGDVFAVPANWPFANVFSVGDVVLVVGATLLLHHAAGAPWTDRLPGFLGGQTTGTTAGNDGPDATDAEPTVAFEEAPASPIA